MKNSSILICLCLLASCTEGQTSLSNTEDSDELQSQQPMTLISFETIDANRYWSWLDPNSPPEERIQRLMFESDPDTIDALIEQLHEAEKELTEAGESLTEIEWLEYQFFTHMYLSTLYRRNADEASHDQLRLIIDYQKTAIEYIDKLIEKDEAYKVDRAFPELELMTVTCWERVDRECFDGIHHMLDKYDKTPIGPYPEYFSTNFILPGMFYYFSDADDKTLRQDYIEALEQRAEQTDLLGISVRLHLARDYLRNRELEKARHLLHDISELDRQLAGPDGAMPDDLQRFFKQMDDLYHHLSEHEMDETTHDD